MNCPACHGPTIPRKRYAVREYQLESGDVFHYEPCGQCGTSTIVDPPRDLGPYYPATYEPFAKRTGAVLDARRRLGLDDRWRALRRVRPARDARVLDAGCGSGDFLTTLWWRGFRHLTGVDPYLPFEPYSDGARRFVRGELADLRGESFDVITMHHVLEHASNTQRFLADAAALLAPGGALLVRVPLLDSWASRTYGARWVQHDAPRHLVLLTSDGLGRAAAAVGLRVESSWRDEGRWQAWAGATLAAGANPFGRVGVGTKLARVRYSLAAAQRNRAGTGDQGCFVLRHAEVGA